MVRRQCDGDQQHPQRQQQLACTSTWGGNATVTNSTLSTLSDNTSAGLYFDGGGNATVTNSTLSGNTSYGLFFVIGGSVTLTNTLLAKGTNDNCRLSAVAPPAAAITNKWPQPRRRCHLLRQRCEQQPGRGGGPPGWTRSVAEQRGPTQPSPSPPAAPPSTPGTPPSASDDGLASERLGPARGTTPGGGVRHRRLRAARGCVVRARRQRTRDTAPAWGRLR